jgi:hypothetical protein
MKEEQAAAASASSSRSVEQAIPGAIPATAFHCTRQGCSRRFDNKRSRRLHEKFDHDQPFRCARCSRSFRSARLLEDHRLDSRIKPCRPVKRRGPRESPAIKSSSSAAAAAAAASASDRWECSLCHLSFSSRKGCQVHIDAYTDKFQCQECSSRFGKQFDLDQHVKRRKKKGCIPVQKDETHAHAVILKKQPWEVDHAHPVRLRFAGAASTAESSESSSDSRESGESDELDEDRDPKPSTVQSLFANLVRLHPVNASETNRARRDFIDAIEEGRGLNDRYECSHCRRSSEPAAAADVRSYTTRQALLQHIHGKHLRRWPCQRCRFLCASKPHQQSHEATCQRQPPASKGGSGQRTFTLALASKDVIDLLSDEDQEMPALVEKSEEQG